MHAQPDSPFDLLCQELADFQASRAARRDTVTRAPAMKKSAPVAPTTPPDFDRLAKTQAAIAADMAKSHTLHVQDKIRTRIADLRKAAAAGRLTAMDGARLDVLIGQAAALGLRP